MSGPGGIEAGRVRIRALPDTQGFAEALRADLERIEQEVVVELPTALDLTGARDDLDLLQDEISLADATVTVDLDTGAAAAELDELARDRRSHVTVEVDKASLTRVTGVLGKLNGSLAALNPTKMAALSSGLAAAAYSAGNLAAALVPAAGALGLLPAAGFAGAAGIATLTIGLQGFGDAAKAVASGDAKKLAEAMKGLAPAAQETVRQLQSMAPAFRDLKQGIQQSLFTDVAANLEELGGTFLPILKTQLSGIAETISAGFTATAGSLLEPATVAYIQTALGNVREAFAQLVDIGYNLTGAFAAITAVGSQFLPDLASGLNGAIESFSVFVATAAQTGQLQEWIGAGLSAIGDLADIAGAAAQAIWGIVSAAQSVGGGSLAGILSVVRGLSDVINSPAGQGALQEIFAGVAVGLGELMKAVGPIGEIFAAIAPVISEVAGELGIVLAAAIKAIAPVIVALAPALADFARVLGGALEDGIRLLTPLLARLAQSLAANRPLLIAVGLAAAAMTGPLGLVAAAVAGVIVLWQKWGPQITDLAQRISSGLQPVFAAFAAAAQSLWPALQGLGSAMAGWASTVLPIVQQVAQVFIDQWPAIQTTIATVFGSVVSIIRSALTIVTQVIRAATAVIGALWDSGFGQVILSIVRGVFSQVLNVIRTTWSVISGLFRTIAAILTGDWSGAWQAIKDTVSAAVGGMIRGLQNMVTTVGGIFKGLGELALNAVKGFGTLLFDAGKKLIQGLIDGIKSMVGAVGDAIGGIADKIGGFLPGSPVREGPLTKWNNGMAGKRLVGLLADGLGDTTAVEQAARRIAATVATTVTPALGGGRLSLTSTGAVPAAAGMQVNFTGPIYARDDDAVVRDASARAARAMTLAGVGL